MSSESLERVWREERAPILGSLARQFGDLDLAEDSVQEAFLAAQRRWPLDGQPEKPGAWLRTVAYRKAIGMIRKQRPTVPLGSHTDASHIEALPARGSVDDDLLGLLLACCHPTLNSQARIGLTLRHVCGLTVEEISAGFLIPEATMAKRLVRARAKIKDAKIPFAVPDDQTVRARLSDIHTVIYVVFTEGHLASGGRNTVRTDLCEEAIWLARQIVGLQPASAESRGLLALLLLQHARHSTRVDPQGHLVRFDEQNRNNWDTAAIDEARSLLADPDVHALGPYRVEAAIAALHIAHDIPDWARIADLYGVLVRLAPSPIVEVNRSIAVGRADGPRAGLAIIEPILRTGRLDQYPHAHAAHAELLEHAGDIQGAIDAWQRGADTAGNNAQRSAMAARTQLLTSDTSP